MAEQGILSRYQGSGLSAPRPRAGWCQRGYKRVMPARHRELELHGVRMPRARMRTAPTQPRPGPLPLSAMNSAPAASSVGRVGGEGAGFQLLSPLQLGDRVCGYSCGPSQPSNRETATRPDPDAWLQQRPRGLCTATTIGDRRAEVPVAAQKRHVDLHRRFRDQDITHLAEMRRPWLAATPQIIEDVRVQHTRLGHCRVGQTQQPGTTRRIPRRPCNPVAARLSLRPLGSPKAQPPLRRQR